MRHKRLLGFTVAGLLFVVTACIVAPTQKPTSVVIPTAKPTRKIDTPAAAAAYTPTATSLATFILTGEQAQEVTIFMEFIRAHNAGQFQAALALFDDQIVGSDCDYQKVSVIQFEGKSQAAEWLRQRIADHDRLEVSRVLNENPDPISGRHVLGVEYGRRTSDTLAKLGFVNGITPKLRSKVVFNTESTRITAFANGPGRGDASDCRPEN